MKSICFRKVPHSPTATLNRKSTCRRKVSFIILIINILLIHHFRGKYKFLKIHKFGNANCTKCTLGIEYEICKNS